MLNILKNIPDIKTHPLKYVFEIMKLKHKSNTLWLEFGVATGNSINYISKFTNDKVYGFDSFEGLPEKWRDGFDKGSFNMYGNLPQVNHNVELIKGWFSDTLVNFIQSQNKKISFIHMDADLYSSTKYIFDTLKDYIDNNCVIVFDELVNYDGFDGNTGELKAFYEFVTENSVDYRWIGMNGVPLGMSGYKHENVAVLIHPTNENNTADVNTIYEEDTKICFITAIYGNYESSCKNFVKQTIKTDFICFTDNKNINSNGWTIDTTPYHLINKSELDKDNSINSISNNKNTFNIAKYYKQAFHNIPLLKKYDIIVWIDGTIEITYNKTSEYILNNIYKQKIIGWHHEHRRGILKSEVEASCLGDRYLSTYYNGQPQPYQDVNHQYDMYLKNGYDERFFKLIPSYTDHLGVWITCFVAFLNNDNNVKKFLDLWYQQTLEYTTQDQIGFSYVCQKTRLIPFTLPNKEVYGDNPHSDTMFYIKHYHGL
jgi:hypothetical protein